MSAMKEITRVIRLKKISWGWWVDMQKVTLSQVLRAGFWDEMTLIFKLRLERSKLSQLCELLEKAFEAEETASAKTSEYLRNKRGRGGRSVLSSENGIRWGKRSSVQELDPVGLGGQGKELEFYSVSKRTSWKCFLIISTLYYKILKLTKK